MGYLFRRVTNTFFALLFAVLSINLTGVMSLQNAYADNQPNYNPPAGNNGTLKVHEKNTPSDTKSNDPIVCIFNFEIFGVDASQTGDITVEGHGNTPAGTYLTIPIASDLSGNGESDYVNDGGSFTLADGHYNATLENKFGTDSNDKAKSKVFKVDCPDAATPAIPAIPTFIDLCGNNDDSYTIPQLVEGVEKYRVKDLGTGTVIVANAAPRIYPYNDGNEIKIVAIADDGYVFSNGDKEVWKYTYTNEVCPPEEVTPLVPTHIDECGVDNDSYTIPELTTGVKKYRVNIDGAGWVSVGPGPYSYTGAGEVKIRAVADDGYVMPNGGHAMLIATFNFTNEDCHVTPSEPTVVDVCGTTDDRFVISDTEGVTYKVWVLWHWVTVSAGEYWGVGDVKIKAVAQYGYYLDGTTNWNLHLSPRACPVIASVDYVDECGSKNDSYTIPTTDHVTYKKLTGYIWWIVPVYSMLSEGPYEGAGSVKIKAFADPGYKIDGQSSWNLNFDSSDCKAEISGDPTFDDQCGVNNDSYEVVTATGVIYKQSINGGIPVEVAPGTYFNNSGSDSIVITAEAMPNYVYTGQDSWNHVFTNTDCMTAEGLCEAGQGGVMLTITNFKIESQKAYIHESLSDTYSEHDVPALGYVQVFASTVSFKAGITVHAGNETLVLDKKFDCTPGRGNITPPIVTPINTPLELPLTGAHSTNPLSAILAIVSSALVAYGASYYLTNRRDLSKQ